jgi:hypothetical protein
MTYHRAKRKRSDAGAHAERSITSDCRCVFTLPRFEGKSQAKKWKLSTSVEVRKSGTSNAYGEIFCDHVLVFQNDDDVELELCTQDKNPQNFHQPNRK